MAAIKPQEVFALVRMTRKEGFAQANAKPRVVAVYGRPEAIKLGAGPFEDEIPELLPRDFVCALNEKIVGRSVKRKELGAFYLAFSKTYGRSSNIQKALELCATQARCPKMRGIIGSMRVSIGAGKELYEAMSAHTEVFGSVAIWMVRTGSITGNTSKVFSMLAVQLQKEGRLVTKIIRNFSYPAIMVALALGMFFVMEFTIIPMMVKTFSELHGTLPLVTRIFASISDILRAAPILVPLPYVVPVLIYVYWRKIRNKEWVQRASVRMRVIGPIVESVIVSRALRIMAMLISSGIPIEKACTVVAEVSGNIVYKHYFLAVRAQLELGKDPAMAFLIERDRVGDMGMLIASQVGIGSPSGSTDELFEQVSTVIEEETDLKVELAFQFVQPFILFGIAFGILLILVAIYYPGFAMLMQELRRK